MTDNIFQSSIFKINGLLIDFMQSLRKEKKSIIFVWSTFHEKFDSALITPFKCCALKLYLFEEFYEPFLTLCISCTIKTTLIKIVKGCEKEKP